MARKTRLGLCKKCEEEKSSFGVGTSFYVVSSMQQRERPASPSKKQIRGSLPTYGLCIECFMRFAKQRGMDASELKALRRQLDSGG